MVVRSEAGSTAYGSERADPNARTYDPTHAMRAKPAADQPSRLTRNPMMKLLTPPIYEYPCQQHTIPFIIYLQVTNKKTQWQNIIQISSCVGSSRGLRLVVSVKNVSIQQRVSDDRNVEYCTVK
jgi:hypothetical protein